LEEQQERPVGSVGVGNLAREDGYPLAVRRAVIEREPKLVLGAHKARDPMADGHAGILPTGRDLRPKFRSAPARIDP
jgi:hypothetical protein